MLVAVVEAHTKKLMMPLLPLLVPFLKVAPCWTPKQAGIAAVAIMRDVLGARDY